MQLEIRNFFPFETTGYGEGTVAVLWDSSNGRMRLGTAEAALDHSAVSFPPSKDINGLSCWRSEQLNWSLDHTVKCYLIGGE